VFLFDEPLSNLDAALRADIRLEIADLVRRLGATALYVTHDHVEAMTLGDRIAVMNRGRVLQIAPAKAVYEQPATSFVATFLGSPRMNLLPARAEGEVITAGAFRFARPAGRLPARLVAGVRPEHVTFADEGVAGLVLATEPLGPETNLVVRVGEHDLRLRVRGFEGPARGAEVRVAIDARNVLFFDEEDEGARIG